VRRWLNRSLSGRGRGLALAVALLLLLGQTLAIAHVHLADFQEHFDRTQLAESFCPLCLLHFHSPSSPGAMPLVARPVPSQLSLATGFSEALFSESFSALFSRAPPAQF
jgi:hypothetical protein